MKPIPGYPDYFATEEGEIYTARPSNRYAPRLKSPRRRNKVRQGNYWALSMTINGVPICRRIGYLVLLTFVGPRPAGMQVCHGPRGSLDDSLDNLSWGTVQKNTLDRLRDGTENLGVRNHFAKLNELQVRVIRRAYELGGGKNIPSRKKVFARITYQYLADVFQVEKRATRAIVNRELWTHI